MMLMTSSPEDQFARDGYLCCRQTLSLDEVTAWSQRYGSRLFFDDIFAQLYRHGHTTRPQHRHCVEDGQQQYALGQGGVKNGFREIVMRSPGRYEIAIPASPERDELVRHVQQCLPWVPKLLVPMPQQQHQQEMKQQQSLMNDDDCPTNAASTTNENSWIANNGQNVVDCDTINHSNNNNEATAINRNTCSKNYAATWTDVRIINVSVVVSTPGAPAQGWHADGGHVDLQQHLPCHCLNVFLPLIPVRRVDLGPTELRPGSHHYTRNLAPMMLAAKARRQLRPTVAPLLELGDALIFDYRLLHRGLAHTAETQHRPILVVTVAQPWFKDILNFPTRSLYDAVAEPPAPTTDADGDM